MALHYVDFEFNGLGGKNISLSVLREDNVAMYVGFKDSVIAPEEYDPWVLANVIPILNSAPIPIRWRTTSEIQEDLKKFFKGDKHPIIITDWFDDVARFAELMLTGPGTTINSSEEMPNFTFQVCRVDAYPTEVKGAIAHCAFWNTVALKHKLQFPHGESLKKSQFITSVDTLLWEYIGDLSQDIDECSYNEDTIRHYWNTNTLDERVAGKLKRYPSPPHNRLASYRREDGRYRDLLTALVIKHGGWAPDWGSTIGALTANEQQIVDKFLAENTIIYPPGETFHVPSEGSAEDYVRTMAVEMSLTNTMIREMWNNGQLRPYVIQYMADNYDLDLKQYHGGSNGRYADLLTYYVKKDGNWVDDRGYQHRLTDEELVRIAAFNYEVRKG